MSQVSFDGYQINHKQLALSGTISKDVIRQILGEEDLTHIIKLTLDGCIANRLNISKIKARLTNLQHVSIKEMQLNTRLFEHLAHSSVTKLSFKKCTVPFAHRAFTALSYFENLSHVDVSRTNLSQSNRNMLRNAAPNLTILDSTRPKPILNNNTGYVRQDYPDAPEAPRANRVKRPRARR